MDHDESLRWLRGGAEGIAEWNRHRGAGEVLPDLTGAHLAGADLREADLRRAHLGGAHLGGAHLTRADLRGADLGGAHLTRADLRGADLRRAHLGGADLTRARCGGTSFGDVDLSGAKGLESVLHTGPSPISTSTLIISRGTIPATFLRGCGLPDNWIEYLPSLIHGMQPIQFYSCFISYSTNDDDFATRLHSRMVQEGLRVWFAPEAIQGGKTIHGQIDEAIRLHDKLLLVLSDASMQSRWVATEIRRTRRAEEREGRRKLFPIRLVDYQRVKAWELPDSEGEDLAEVVREFFMPDFSRWKDHDAFEAAFARLLRDLKAEAARGDAEAPGR